MATVAAEDPEIAANRAHPTTLTCTKPPGSFCIHGDNPSNKFSDNLVRNKISPIQTNKGSAVKVHEDEAPQIVVAIASPTGLVVNSIIPIDETPTMLIATQIPEPKNIKRTLIKNIVSKISVIFFCLYFQN